MLETPKKAYILDTNVLIHDPQSMFSFERTLVGIPAVVLEELDQFKGEASDRGSSAREVIRQFDALRAKGSLRDGVKLDNGTTLQVLFADQPGSLMLPGLNQNLGDNEILRTALSMQSRGYQVTFVSKDINARVKADVLNIKAEDYLKGRVAEYGIYKGWRSEPVASGDLRKDFPDILKEMAEDGHLKINEFVELASKGNPSHYRLFRYLGGDRFKALKEPSLAWPLPARNPQQIMALDLLLDEEIKLVSLIGPAGTGKTFLALLAGLHQVLSRDVYRKILISRPVIPLGPDIGYLPGDVQEKLESWMQPMYDNLSLIMHSAAHEGHVQQIEGEERGNYYKKRRHDKNQQNGRWQPKKQKMRNVSMDDLIHSGKLSLEAMTYMRGRSIPFQYILIDEVQNLTLHEVKTLITRVGEGSKIVLSGDPYQIDSPYLDFNSNGLMVASNAFRGQSLFGTVFLETTERSELSRLASALL